MPDPAPSQSDRESSWPFKALGLGYGLPSVAAMVIVVTAF